MKISVVTSYCGQEELTKNMLDNLQGKTPDKYELEVILLNNSKGEIFIEHPVVHQRVDFNRFMSFSEGFNVGLLLTSGDYIVLMGNDIFPLKDDWVDKFLEVMEETDAALVSPLYLTDYRPYYRASRYLEGGKKWEEAEFKAMITANCWMMNRKKMYYFDPHFYGGFGGEDLDLAHRAQNDGHHVVRALNLILDHRHNQGETAKDADLKKGENNSEKYFKKWY